jgi:hypothetical protein
MRLSRIVALSTLIASLSVATAWADSPQMIPVQGTLYDATGRPYSGSLSVGYTIYGNQAGTVTLWTDSIRTSFTQGLFTTYLGEESPINLAIFRDYADVWVGISIDGEPEIGRFRVATAPFSGYSDYCGAAAVLSETGAATVVDEALLAADERYAPIDHTTDWADINGVPAGFADGVDNTVTEAEVDTFVANNGYQLASGSFPWAQVSGVPAGFADGVDNTVTEAEVDTFVANNGYQLASGNFPWAQVSGVPAGFADGVDNDNDSFASRTCPTGQVLVSTGPNAWSCQNPGDITAVIAGNGLTGGSASGDATLNVNFGGTGSSTQVARADHTHATLLQRRVIATGSGTTDTLHEYSTVPFFMSIDATYAGRTLQIPHDVIVDYCADPEGCRVNVGMTRWSSITQNASASRTVQFFYSTINGAWRADNDAEGVDGNSATNHAINAFNACYFTDMAYLAFATTGDAGSSMHLLMWNEYSGTSRTCSITIWD